MATRRALPHAIPLAIDPSREIWFITICCQERNVNHLARDEVSVALIETIRFRHDRKRWWTWLALLMPDHLHLMLSFPPEADG